MKKEEIRKEIEYHCNEINRLSDLYSNSISATSSSLLLVIKNHRNRIKELEMEIEQ